MSRFPDELGGSVVAEGDLPEKDEIAQHSMEVAQVLEIIDDYEGRSMLQSDHGK